MFVAFFSYKFLLLENCRLALLPTRRSGVFTGNASTNACIMYYNKVPEKRNTHIYIYLYYIVVYMVCVHISIQKCICMCACPYAKVCGENVVKNQHFRLPLSCCSTTTHFSSRFAHCTLFSLPRTLSRSCILNSTLFSFHSEHFKACCWRCFIRIVARLHNTTLQVLFCRYFCALKEKCVCIQ